MSSLSLFLNLEPVLGCKTGSFQVKTVKFDFIIVGFFVASAGPEQDNNLNLLFIVVGSGQTSNTGMSSN